MQRLTKNVDCTSVAGERPIARLKELMANVERKTAEVITSRADVARLSVDVIKVHADQASIVSKLAEVSGLVRFPLRSGKLDDDRMEE